MVQLVKGSVVLCLLTLVAGSGLVCDPSLCPLDWIGDGYCDLACMTEACEWDWGPEGSDCNATCISAGCGERIEGDAICRPQCNIAACGWDWGGCGVCVSGCKSQSGTADLVDNGTCESICSGQSCSYDGGDCVRYT